MSKLFSVLLLFAQLCASSAFVTVPAQAFMSSTTTTTTTPWPITYAQVDTKRFFDLGSMISNFGKKVTASHILIGPPTSVTGRGMEQDEATAFLTQLKQDIDNDPAKFAAAAAEYSSCRATSDKGGDLGEFGPGLMVKSIDEICFQQDVGVVHGPVSSPYGEHLVLVRERS